MIEMEFSEACDLASILSRTVKAVSQGLSEAEIWADKEFGGRHKAGMIFSFADKPDFSNNPVRLRAIVRKLGVMKKGCQ